MKTDQRLVSTAKALLDAGGENAVTLRAIAQAVGLSHNAPYKHFADRKTILAAVAIEDFQMISQMFAEIRRTRAKPLNKLKKALSRFVAYSRDYPARYHLLFNNPEIAATGGQLRVAAFASFTEFSLIVGECQAAELLPQVPNAQLTGLIYASVHGLIELRASGQLREEKGFSSVTEGIELLLKLITTSPPLA